MYQIKLTLAAARVNAGLSQREAAKIFGISTSTLCSWERGATKVSKLGLAAMANKYGVPEECLIVPGESAKCEQEA